MLMNYSLFFGFLIVYFMIGYLFCEIRTEDKAKKMDIVELVTKLGKLDIYNSILAKSYSCGYEDGKRDLCNGIYDSNK